MNQQNIKLDHLIVSTTDAQVARRATFAAQKEEMESLAASITEHGVLQAIVVRKAPADDMFEIVAGERRYLAAAIAGLEEIPATVRELSDEQVIQIQLIENLQRSDLHPMHEAEGYSELMSAHGQTIEEVYGKVGKSRSYVYGRLKLLALCAAARKAFYANKISPSIALLIARIPAPALQVEALAIITNPHNELSFRRAKEVIQDRFMLRLSEAPFDKKDAMLLSKAGACVDCQFRTGNQPELFGDVKSTDVCTNTKCYADKIKAHGKQLVGDAKKSGRRVLTAEEVKKATKWGTHSLQGYEKADAKNWTIDASGKRTNRQVLGKEIEPALLQVPDTGEVIEVYTTAQVKRGEKKASGNKASPKSFDQKERDQRNETKIDKAFRLALYGEIRPCLLRPDMRDIARTMYDRLGSDAIKLLYKVRDFEPPVKKGKYGDVTDHDAIVDDIENWPPARVNLLVNDCMYVTKLMVDSYGGDMPETLLEAAADAGIDVKAVRASVTPKKKAAKKKAPAKKKASKKNAKSTAGTTSKAKGRAKK